jgi:hypothetical protein
MDLGISTLKLEDGRCLAIDADGIEEDLAEAYFYKSVFIAAQGEWQEVDVGQVEEYEGEINGQAYRGPAVWFRYSGSLGPGRVFPAPGVKIGTWIACQLSATGQYWGLETGMLIRSPLSGGEFASGTYSFAPRGRCVATFSRADHPLQAQVDGTDIRFALRRTPLGKVAFDLAHFPFPQDLWLYDDGVFRESSLEIRIETEDYALSHKILGDLESEALFWLF